MPSIAYAHLPYLPVDGIIAIRRSIRAILNPPTTTKGSINPPTYM